MKPLLISLILALASCVPVFSQQTTGFTFDFGASPPPHTPGVPNSAALLEDDLFSAAIYLSGNPPTSGRIVELGEGGALQTIFNFSGLVFAAYPGGTAYSCEQSWSLSAPQIQSLMEGEWYAEVSYPGSSYPGRIVPIPEPSSFALAAGVALIA